MAIDADQLRVYIVEPALEDLNAYSESAVELVMGTCAQESHLGTYVKQIRGPAMGIFQMEPATHDDIHENYLRYKRRLEALVVGDGGAFSERMVFDLDYACKMCRVHYLRVNEPLPHDLDGWAYYWKKYYNTYHGRGTEEEFIENYERFCT